MTRTIDHDTPTPVITKAGFRLVRSLLLLAPLAGCGLPSFLTYPPQLRGNNIESYQLDQLVPGTSTRNDVTALLGSPTTKATFDENSWLYIGEVTRPVIAGTQKVLDQQVVIVTFDDKGVLRSISRKNAGDSMEVGMASGATPSPGSEANIMQQLLGNVGRFNALGTGASGGGGGATGAPASSSSY